MSPDSEIGMSVLFVGLSVDTEDDLAKWATDGGYRKLRLSWVRLGLENNASDEGTHELHCTK